MEFIQIHTGWKTREVVEGVRGGVLFLQSSKTHKLAHKALRLISFPCSMPIDKYKEMQVHYNKLFNYKA